jgi:hypothetical protein
MSATTGYTNPLTPTLIPKWITALEAFIRAHERIILIGVTSLLIWHFGDKALDTYKSTRDAAAQTAINQQIATDKAATDALTAQLAQLQVNFNTVVAQQNAIIAKSKQTLIVQQKTDAALPLPELSQRWALLVGSPPEQIAPQPNGTIAVSTDAAHNTVTELDKIPALNTQLVATQTELNQCTALSSQKDATLAQTQKELADETTGRATDAKAAKDAQATAQKKSFWKGTKVGAAIATVAIVAVKILIIAAK